MPLETSSPTAEVATTDSPEIIALRKEMDNFGGEDVVFEKFGIGAEELVQPLKFGEFEARLWDAVKDSLIPEEERPADKKICPLGDSIIKAKEEGGSAAVAQNINALKVFDPNFKAEISPRTIARAATLPSPKDRVKKKIIPSQAR